MKNIIEDIRTLNHRGIMQALDQIGEYAYTHLDNRVTIEGEGVAVVPASGRSRCRITGERIPKGDLAITGLYDFNGAGSYTCQKIYISLEAYLEKC